MKVLLLNGSPNADGCTNTALREVADALEKNGIETELVHLGKKPVRGCIACGQCRKLGKCVFDDDVANAWLAKMQAADGIVIGSPVYYASPNGAFVAVLDRVFFSGGRSLAHKPAAAVVSARRAGTTASLDMLNKYFLISQMPVVSARYWNMVHGNTPDEVRQDAEGLGVMRDVGENMAWMLRCIEAGKAQGVNPPEHEPLARTNFIREL